MCASARSFHFGPRRVSVNLDIHNVLNLQPRAAAERQLRTSPGRRLQGIMEARLFKLSTNIDF